MSTQVSATDVSLALDREQKERLLPQRIHRVPSPGQRRWTRYGHSIWLFTFSDLKTIVGPKTSFGVLTALAGPLVTSNPSPSPSSILLRTPLVLLWVWINLLPFAIDNQRRPGAIAEDTANKPWRPLPSRIVTPSEAKKLMQLSYCLAFAVSWYLHSLTPCVSLMFLGWCYNELGGADGGFGTRNLINALGFICYTSGATGIASQAPFQERAWVWFAVVGAVVFSSVQMQDMCDQAGDKLQGRRTMPLVLGDGFARWTIALPVLFWSLFCPLFWDVGLQAYGPPIAAGVCIAARVVGKRSVEDDKATFKVWNLWMVLLYLLPLVKHVSETR